MCNGFGNRFLWFVVKSDKIMPRTVPIPDEVFAPFIDQLKAVKRFGDEANDDQAVEMDAGGAARWEEVYPQLRMDRPGLAGAMTSRGHALVLRLALIYALLDCPVKRTKLFGPKLLTQDLKVRACHLEAGLAVWDYCRQSAEQLFGNRSGNALGDKILKLLSGGPMSKTEMNKHLSPAQKAEVGVVLAELEATRLVRRTKKDHDGPGRPTELWERVKRPPGG
jgi:hypothetical protein